MPIQPLDGIDADAGAAKKSRRPMHPVLRKVLSFGLVGVLSGILYALFVATARTAFSFGATTASAIAYALVIPINFWLQRGYTFRSTDAPTSDVARYAVAQLINGVLCVGLMSVAVDGAGLHFGFGIALGILVAPVITYFLMDRWVFAKQRQ